MKFIFSFAKRLTRTFNCLSTPHPILLPMALALAGCAAPQTVDSTLTSPRQTSTPLIATSQSTEPHPVLLYDEWPLEGFPNDAAQITSASLEDDILTLKVVYPGGCREHTFELHAFTAFLLSKPPQGVLHLSHDSYGDACEAYIEESLKFDLTLLNKERNDPGERPLLLNLYEPRGGSFSMGPVVPRIEWP